MGNSQGHGLAEEHLVICIRTTSFAIIAVQLQFNYSTTKCIIKIVTISQEGAREREKQENNQKRNERDTSNQQCRGS